MEKLYEAEVTTLAGRNGHAKSSDGLLDVDIRFPKEMGGAGDATNPNNYLQRLGQLVSVQV